eukprot:71640-Prymnesium_polylepis.1
MRRGCWAGLWFRSPLVCAHAPRRHTDAARAQLRVARAPAAAAAAVAAAASSVKHQGPRDLNLATVSRQNQDGRARSWRGPTRRAC